MKETKIKVLALFPMELPKEIELDNTLEAMQKFVGGNIECRPLWDGADVLAGPGFLAGCDTEGNMTSLPQHEMDFYKENFRAFIIEI